MDNYASVFFSSLFPVDWVVANMLAVRQGSIGHIRYILKDGLRYLPLYGFYFRQVGRHDPVSR